MVVVGGREELPTGLYLWNMGPPPGEKIWFPKTVFSALLQIISTLLSLVCFVLRFSSKIKLFFLDDVG